GRHRLIHHPRCLHAQHRHRRHLSLLRDVFHLPRQRGRVGSRQRRRPQPHGRRRRLPAKLRRLSRRFFRSRCHRLPRQTHPLLRRLPCPQFRRLLHLRPRLLHPRDPSNPRFKRGAQLSAPASFHGARPCPKDQSQHCPVTHRFPNFSPLKFQISNSFFPAFFLLGSSRLSCHPYPHATPLRSLALASASSRLTPSPHSRRTHPFHQFRKRLRPHPRPRRHHSNDSHLPCRQSGSRHAELVVLPPRWAGHQQAADSRSCRPESIRRRGNRRQGQSPELRLDAPHPLRDLHEWHRLATIL